LPVRRWRGGVSIVEMGTPLLKNEGVSNVVPAFRRKFPEALLLADMKTMDGGAFRSARRVCGGGNIIDFPRCRRGYGEGICGVRDEFRNAGAELPRLVFADIMVPHQGPAAQPATSPSACRAGVTASVLTCRPTRGAPTPDSSRAISR
jgi:hypothetical protein